MLHSILTYIDQVKSFKTVSAHCDIPCKIYDPYVAQLAALTMIRLVDLISELEAKDNLTVAEQAQLGRLTSEKESHGLKLKEEVRIIWGDYYKAPQIEKIPNIHELTHNIMLQASKVKQGVNRDDALALLNLVNEFTEAFWTTKDINCYKATSPFLPNETVVYPQLTPL